MKIANTKTYSKITLGKPVKGSVRNSIHIDVHRFMRDSTFETMLDSFRSPLRNVIRIPVRDRVANPINIIIWILEYHKIKQ